jgi:hypothetical protein
MFDILFLPLFDRRLKFPEDESLEDGNLVFLLNGLEIISFGELLFKSLF